MIKCRKRGKRAIPPGWLFGGNDYFKSAPQLMENKGKVT